MINIYMLEFRGRIYIYKGNKAMFQRKERKLPAREVDQGSFKAYAEEREQEMKNTNVSGEK